MWRSRVTLSDTKSAPHVHLSRALALVGLGLLPATLAAQDLSKLQDETVRRTKEYLRINTTNPPGNEADAMKWFAGIFKAEGIPFDTASSAPGRGNIWARLKGGPKPALVLLHHMDVVPADPRYWSEPPFDAVEKNGEIYGRGALDTKTLGVVELETFLALHRAQVPLDRDVIFLATADEEAGGSFGAGWVVKNHPEAFRGAGMLLNEGGEGDLRDGREQFSVEVTQKTPLWLKLTATGEPGHGAEPRVASAVNRLVRALYRVQTYQFAPHIGPAVDTYFKALAANAPPRWKAAFADMSKTVQDPDALLALQLDDRGLAALTRNTCSITMLQGSQKINVIPPQAEAQLDCRLLPEQDHAAFRREIDGVIDDPAIAVATVLDFTPAVSPTDNTLYQAIAETIKQHFANASIAPAVSTGFTDSHFFRDLGIASYGFAPFLIPAEEGSGVHGNDERISVENLRRGTALMLDIVRRVTGAPAPAGAGAR